MWFSPDSLCVGVAVLPADTSLRGSDPCALDLDETKSFVERRERDGGEMVEGGGR